MKIEKGKTYTYEEIKEIYENAKIESISNPTKKQGKRNQTKNRRCKFSNQIDAKWNDII